MLFPHHLQHAEMFTLRRSDTNELEQKFLPACVAGTAWFPGNVFSQNVVAKYYVMFL